MSRTIRSIPLSVQDGLRKLGADIRSARLRRRISTSLLAERAFISRQTLIKVERGDAAVSLGIYATVLFVLGFAERLAELADPRFDEIGLQLGEKSLPKRIRKAKQKTPSVQPPHPEDVDG